MNILNILIFNGKQRKFRFDISKQNFKSVEQIRSNLSWNQNVGHHE